MSTDTVTTEVPPPPRRFDPVAIGYNALALLLALLVAMIVGGLAIALSGHNPFVAFADMVKFAACNDSGIGGPCTADSAIQLVIRSVPYYLSGLAVAIGFRMALFNIGVEGQYRLAALAVAIVGVEVHLPAVLQVPLLLIVAMGTGAIWAGIAGLLKITRGVSEVISTIMLNYVAYGIIAWALSAYLAGRGSNGNNLSSATPTLPAASQVPGLNHLLHSLGLLGHHADQVPGFLIVAVIVGTGFYLLVERSRFGFELRATGINPFAAQAGGVSSRKMILITLLISGAIAGLVALPYVMGTQHNYSDQLPSNLGFNGIAVALLGRNKPVGIAFAALLWGFLEQSALILNLNGIPQEIYILMQGSAVLAVVVAYEVVRRARVRRAEREVARQLPEALGGAVEVTA